MNKSASQLLVMAVQESFERLIQKGYRIVEDSVCESPTQVLLELVGKNVGLRFSLDMRDGVIDLYVTKAVNGRSAKRGSGAYFDRLTGYLRERRLPFKTTGCSQSGSLSLEDRIKLDVRAYAEVILNSAPAIADDTESF
jgi:hypothetical protein